MSEQGQQHERVVRVNGNDKKRDESIVRVVVVPGLAWNDSMQAAADSSQQL